MPYRPASFRLGSMRQRITIQSVAVALSDAGDKTETWSALYTNEPARFDSTSGTETLRGKQVESGINCVFTIHYRENIDSTCRVVYAGNNYGIVYVKEVDGGQRYLELYCRS